MRNIVTKWPTFYTRRIDFEPDPKNPANYRSRAESLFYLQDNEKAFADLKKHAEMNPSGAASAYAIVAWRLVERPWETVPDEIAVGLFRKANEIRPDGFLSGLGLACYRAGRWAEAIAALTRSTKLSSDKSSLASLDLLFLSMAHWQLGNKTNSSTWYNKAVEAIHNSNIDITAPSNSKLYGYYLEATALLGVKDQRFQP